ncbi:MAG: DCC1-like thiol-disulfide oxidoreductase family protein [Paracoccaceae bacterium]|nr:DCC1-like thiol-disulfide oxidoreductase family protein [Paracoccaceae bacterium]
MSDLQIVYDGDCPFCTRYVTMARIKKSVGTVELIDARSDHPIVAEIKAKGIDLNEGMLARYKGAEYFGADCIHFLSMLSSRSGLMNRAMSVVFSNRSVARFMYPILRFGRNTTLRLMGRAPIS